MSHPGRDVRGQAKAERQSNLAARQCSRCGRWFTVKPRSKDLCPKCEADAGQEGRQSQ
jgi:hypothetical protein